MKVQHKHMYIKLLLIILSEAVAMALTNLVSHYIIPIPHTTLSYIICGAFLAYVVVSLYNRLLVKKKQRIEGELKTLTNVALKRYDTQDKL